jgi:hypothetical protein
VKTNLNVMKKVLMSFVAMATMVLLISSASAVGTKIAPQIDETHTYQWNGLTEGDNYTLYLTTNVSADPSTAESAKLSDLATTFDLSDDDTFGQSSVTSTVAASPDNNASVDIQWFCGTEGNTYFLWLKVVGDADGCSNYTYVAITPVTGINFFVEALGDTNTDWATTQTAVADGTAYCPDVTTNFVADEANYEAGQSTLYYRVTRDNTCAIANDWKFEIELTDNSATAFTNQGDQADLSAYTDGQYNLTVNDGSNNVTPSSGVYTITPSVNTVLVTVLVNNEIAESAEFTVDLNSTGVELTSNAADTDNTDETATLTLNQLPVIGTFQN